MQKSPIALFISAVLFPSSTLFAQENSEVNYNDGIEQLGEIVVHGGSFSQQIGTQRINDSQIANLPSTNGNITELLKTNPNVRFSSSADNANNGGEIAPDEVSFHGEKYYNNAFILNGMSNNDNINPGAASARTAETQPSGTNPYDLPAGGTQSFWINTELLKSVEVFDSNISAKYGNFTGGVVDAKYKDPDLEKASGKISYRTTNDRWAEFFTDDQKTFESASELNLQPKFSKQQYGVMVSQPISDSTAIRVDYQRTTSDIQFYHPALRVYDAERQLSENGTFGNVQRRISENLRFDAVHLPNNGDLWRLSATYAPHRSKYYKKNTVNSAFENIGGGVQLNLEWEKNLDSGKLTTYLGYKNSGNRIKHAENDYHRYMASDYLNWISGSGLAQWGGYGKFSTTSDDYTLKQSFDWQDFDWGNINHKLSVGWTASLKKSSYKRDNDSYLYTYVKNADVVCNGDSTCITGDQYARSYRLYEAQKFSVSDNTYSAYIQDIMKYKRLEVSAGLRIDYNQFYGKLNFAPRLSGSFDVFGDQNTRLIAGLNRYYDGSMLAYKFRQNLGQNLNWRRSVNEDGTLSEWTGPTVSYQNAFNTSRLDNPYSDEIVAGISQKFLSSIWTLKWVHRDKKKELVRSYAQVGDTVYNVLSNDGWTKNDTITLSAEPENNSFDFNWAKVAYSFGFSYNKTKSNNRYYSADPFDNKPIIYNGVLMQTPEGLVPVDFNEPWKITFNMNTEFPKWRLNWNQRLSFIKGRQYLYNDGEISCNGTNTAATAYRTACGDYVGEVKAYKDAYRASHLLLDWRFVYKQPTFKDQYIQVDLDINNVLNRKAVAKSAGGNTAYKMGRNYWLGVSYNW